MDETKSKEHLYSKDRIQTTDIQAPAESVTPPESSHAKNPTPAPQQAQSARASAWAEALKTAVPTSAAGIPGYLFKTRRVWLAAAAVVIGLMGVVTLGKSASEWVKNRRERRMEQAVATVTPEHLIARCGKAAEDETREVYPILMRSMSYQPKGQGKLVIAFSRTAEEQSDWVFLSMKDANGTVTYDTPEAKIAVLPCLNSRK